jgi:hypothetical protein
MSPEAILVTGGFGIIVDLPGDKYLYQLVAIFYLTDRESGDSKR